MARSLHIGYEGNGTRMKDNGTQIFPKECMAPYGAGSEKRGKGGFNLMKYFYSHKNYSLLSAQSALICVLIMFFGFTAYAQSIEDIKVIKISPQDERAIVRTPDEKMRIIKVGDVVGMNAKVIEITTGRIVLEERTEFGKETVIIRVEDGGQRVERIREAGEKRPLLYAPKGDTDEKRQWDADKRR